MGSIPGLGRSPGEEKGLPTPVFWPGEFKDRGAWQATVHGVTKSQTRLSDFHFQGISQATATQLQMIL